MSALLDFFRRLFPRLYPPPEPPATIPFRPRPPVVPPETTTLGGIFLNCVAYANKLPPKPTAPPTFDPGDESTTFTVLSRDGKEHKP